MATRMDVSSSTARLFGSELKDIAIRPFAKEMTNDTNMTFIALDRNSGRYVNKTLVYLTYAVDGNGAALIKGIDRESNETLFFSECVADRSGHRITCHLGNQFVGELKHYKGRLYGNYINFLREEDHESRTLITQQASRFFVEQSGTINYSVRTSKHKPLAIMFQEKGQGCMVVKIKNDDVNDGELIFFICLAVNRFAEEEENFKLQIIPRMESFLRPPSAPIQQGQQPIVNSIYSKEEEKVSIRVAGNAVDDDTTIEYYDVINESTSFVEFSFEYIVKGGSPDKVMAKDSKGRDLFMISDLTGSDMRILSTTTFLVIGSYDPDRRKFTCHQSKHTLEVVVKDKEIFHIKKKRKDDKHFAPDWNLVHFTIDDNSVGEFHNARQSSTHVRLEKGAEPTDRMCILALALRLSMIEYFLYVSPKPLIRFKYNTGS